MRRLPRYWCRPGSNSFQAYLASIIPTPGLTSSSVNGTINVRCAADASRAACGQGEALNQLLSSRPRPHQSAQTLPSFVSLYIIGGPGPTASATSNVRIYDPTTGAWSAGLSMLTPRNSMWSTITPDGVMYVIGGLTTTGNAVNKASQRGKTTR